MNNFQKRRIAIYVHQCLTNNVRKNFDNYFEVTESKINTRNNRTHKSFFFQGGYEHNTLPREIRSKKTINTLK